jgi:hypothetical protein
MIDDSGEIARLAVELERNRRLGEARADRRRQLDAGQRRREIAPAAVRQGDDDGGRRSWSYGRYLSHCAPCSVK